MSQAVSRRDFLKVAGATMAGTAVGGVLALGGDLKPRVAFAQESRIKEAQDALAKNCVGDELDDGATTP